MSKNFIVVMANKYLKLKKENPTLVWTGQHAEWYVKEFLKYYKNLYDIDIAKGKHRKLTHLNSVQYSLSQFKKILLAHGETNKEFLKSLRMGKENAIALKTEKNQNLHNKSIDIPAVDADAIILDCRKLLRRKDPYLRVIAVACLTGRRTAEIIFKMNFDAPTEPHFTSSDYWSRVSGICKQREDDVDKVHSREIPLLDLRNNITRAVRLIRSELPAHSVEEVNLKYGKPIQRAMQKFCAEIGNIHQFRKLYVLVCQHYFNERNCSLPRVAADYLGHKTMSDTVLTYLNFRIKTIGRLNFQRDTKETTADHKME